MLDFQGFIPVPNRLPDRSEARAVGKLDGETDTGRSHWRFHCSDCEKSGKSEISFTNYSQIISKCPQVSQLPKSQYIIEPVELLGSSLLPVLACLGQFPVIFSPRVSHGDDGQRQRYEPGGLSVAGDVYARASLKRY